MKTPESERFDYEARIEYWEDVLRDRTAVEDLGLSTGDVLDRIERLQLRLTEIIDEHDLGTG